MTDAWGYVRLSQDGRDDSLDEQMRQIREYCREHERLQLRTTNNDGENTSGFNPDRDGYQQIREAIREQRVDAIVSRDRARLSRDFDDRLELLLELRANDVEWHVIEAGGRLGVQDTQNAGMEAIHAMTDDMKKRIEIQRARAAMEERQERGCYQGSTPFGLKFHDDGCHLQKSQKWSTLREIFELKNDHGVTAIAQRVGVPKGTVSRILDNGLDYYIATLDEYSAD